MFVKVFDCLSNLAITLISALSKPDDTSELDKANLVLLTKYKSTLSSFNLIILRARAPVFAVNVVLAKDGEVKCSKKTLAFPEAATAEFEDILPLKPYAIPDRDWETN